MRVVRAAAVLLALAAPVGLTIACGSRTGLLQSEIVVTTPLEDGALPPPGFDAPFVDDVPQLDDVIPPIDAKPLTDARPLVCADASDTLIYAVTESNTLLKFDPSLTQFTVIGSLACPDPQMRSPFSMAVNRAGVAFVLYGTYDNGQFPPPPPGNIFRVDLNNAACSATTYVAGQGGFNSFGMAFSSDAVGMGETLYVASDDAVSGRLGAINETSLKLSLVGTFSPAVEGAELTGTGDGRLFAFYALGGQGTSGSIIAQIDKTNAKVIAEAQLPSVTQGGGWAFAFWGKFYLFTNPNGQVNGDPTTVVTQYDPATGALTDVATYPETIDGAGVLTCAPEQ